MSRTSRVVACVLITIASMVTSACTEGGGIGMGVPSSGARWGGGSSGPGVIVGGGPVVR